MVIFSLITYFPSLIRHSQTGSQADKICLYPLGVSTINSVVSSQLLYNLSPQLQHPLLPLGNIPHYLSRWENIVSYQPADTTDKLTCFHSHCYFCLLKTSILGYSTCFFVNRICEPPIVVFRFVFVNKISFKNFLMCYFDAHRLRHNMWYVRKILH
jgi:hypothetical protein